jgi:hypothetical protein
MIRTHLTLIAISVMSATANAASPTCEEWSKFSPADQVTAIGELLKSSLPASVPPTTVLCLQSMEADIAIHTTELCKRDSGSFVPAASKAITTAIEYCQSKPG